MAKRKIKPKQNGVNPTNEKESPPLISEEEKVKTKRIMVTLSPDLVKQIDARMTVQERDALIAQMLTTHFEEVEEREEDERRAEKRRQTFGTVVRQLGETFLP